MRHIMKMYERSLFESIEDDVLDKMLDQGIPFNSLDDNDKHILQQGREHPDVAYNNSRKDDKYVGIPNVLEFIYDDHSIIDKGIDSEIIVSGTVIHNGDEYEGEIHIAKDSVNVRFYDIKGKEFYPNNQQEANSIETMFNDVLKDKVVPGLEQ
jgi:hypothetical protein